jgi:hypothetical protein
VAVLVAVGFCDLDYWGGFGEMLAIPQSTMKARLPEPWHSASPSVGGFEVSFVKGTDYGLLCRHPVFRYRRTLRRLPIFWEVNLPTRIVCCIFDFVVEIKVER